MRRNLRLHILSLSSVLGLGVAVWQAHVMKAQNAVIAEQTSYLDDQVSLQRAALSEESARFESARRIELLAILYEVQDCGQDVPELNCPPVASSRTRQEALKELLGLGDSLDLSKARLDGVELSAVDLTYIRLEGARLSGASISFSDFSGADLSGADLNGADFIGCKFIGADLLYADLTGANFTSAQLAKADLSGAVLRQTRGLWAATLDDAILDGADLSGILTLRQMRLERALGNKLTKLPPGLVIPIAWLEREAPVSGNAERRYYDRRKILRRITRSLENGVAHNPGVAADG